MENTEWLKELTSTYVNGSKEETSEKVLNEECEDCNESSEVNETSEEIKELDEETSNEDFIVSLLEDVQEEIGEELTEQEIETILETVALVVERMAHEMKKGKKDKNNKNC